MAIELARFLGAAMVILLPGIWLARGFSLGDNLIERCANGSSLGLAMVVYLASAISHLDLRLFIFVWALVGLASGLFWFKSLKVRAQGTESWVQGWLIALLILVGVIQFGIALPRQLPAGFFDPRFHLILARQIQLTHHAIDRWPFIDIGLNYPTGSHVLVAVLSNLSGLPVHTVFKDLIPLLNVLSTAQMYVFARRVTGDPLVGLYSAAIYGLWAWAGGIDYFRWGGLPNQLAMLLFIAMLTLWLGMATRAAVGAMAICCAGVILVHHHVMVVAAILLAMLIVWQAMVRGKSKPLLLACAGAIILDSFFLAPYVMRAMSLHSTAILSAGEPVATLAAIPKGQGYAISIVGIVGIVLCVAKKIPRYGVVIIPSAALVILFVCGEYLIPAIMGGGEVGTFFTPSRFLADLNYFLPIFAGGAILFFQRQFKVAAVMALLVLLVGPLADWHNWTDMANLYAPPSSFVAACNWIRNNTPVNTIVDDPNTWTARWTTYLCWRQGASVPLPISEPLADYHAAWAWIPDVLAGKTAPPAADLNLVAIRGLDSYTGQPVLWTDGSGLLVVQEWPITTSSSSEADTPAPKPPGPERVSAPTSR